MNKEKLVQKMKQNGWNVPEEDKYGHLTFIVETISTQFLFRIWSVPFGHKLLIEISGEKMMLEQDFLSVIQYMKAGKENESLIIELETYDSTESVRKKIEHYLEKNSYEQIKVSKKRRDEMFLTRYDKEFYATKDSIEKIDEYKRHYFALEDVLKENYDAKILFDYDRNFLKREDDINFFVNIHYHRCVMQLNMKNNTLELSILDTDFNETFKKWEIYNKKEIKTYVQSYINKMEQTQRVKTLFEIPTDFFNKYCGLNEIMDYYGRQKIYKALLVHYNPKEIEHLSAEFCKNETRKIKLYFAVDKYLCFFDEKAILVNREEEKITIIENQEEINQHIEEYEKNIS